jgi:hypothetical protein
MSCPEEFDALEEALRAYLQRYVRTVRLDHECLIHMDGKACAEEEKEKEALERESKKLTEAITDLSRCLEYAVALAARRRG